jgi:hypothetical protein
MGKAKALGFIADGEVDAAIAHLIKKYKKGKSIKAKIVYHDLVILKGRLAIATKLFKVNSIIEYKDYDQQVNIVKTAVVELLLKKAKFS